MIGLHNLRVLLKHNPQYEIPARRAPILGDHIFKPLVPPEQVDLKIPADLLDLALPEYQHIRDFQVFLTSGAAAFWKGDAIGRG